MFVRAFALGLLLPLMAAKAALGDDTIPGSFIVAKRQPEALVIWDSQPTIVQIVTDKLADADANKLLQRQALEVLAAAADRVKSARTVTVRIVYSKTGAINPAYNAATFVGIEKYAEVTLDQSQITSDAEHWKEAAKTNGALPSFSQLKIIGALPPRS